MRSTIASTLFVTALLAGPSISHALSCAERQFTLDEAYAAADSIIVGLITECREEISSDPWVAGGSDCSFSSIEVLKDAVPARAYTGVASSSACGLSFQVGDQYLFFLDSTNQPMQYSKALSGDPSRTQVAKTYLGTIRDFRNGGIEDLAEPWVFTEADGHCSIWHNIRGNSIIFSRAKPGAPPQPEIDWTRSTIDGETVYRASVPAIDAATNKPVETFEVVAFGDDPNYADGALSLSVHLQDYSPELTRRQTTLTVGSRTWPLNRIEMNLPMPGTPDHIFVEYHTADDAAEQILSAMKTPSDIVVLATLLEPGEPPPNPDTGLSPPSSDVYFGPVNPETNFGLPETNSESRPVGSRKVRKESPERVLRIESRSTQLSKVSESFQACYADK